jgi:hypothetical protein
MNRSKDYLATMPTPSPETDMNPESGEEGSPSELTEFGNERDTPVHDKKRRQVKLRPKHEQ